MLTHRSFEALLLVSCLAACGAPAATPVVSTPELAHCPPAEPTICPDPAPPVAALTPAPIEAPEIQVIAGECNLAAIPTALIEETSAEQSEEIVALVREWVNERGGPWPIPREGILFAKSEDDLGADPPHPTWTQEQGARACGQQTLWLGARLLSQLRSHANPENGSPIRCSGNVCCYSAFGEYDSGGGIVLSRRNENWHLRAGYEVADNGAVGDRYAAERRERVKRRLQRLLRGRCPGEP